MHGESLAYITDCSHLVMGLAGSFAGRLAYVPRVLI